jgi:hypothetical protein
VTLQNDLNVDFPKMSKQGRFLGKHLAGSMGISLKRDMKFASGRDTWFNQPPAFPPSRRTVTFARKKRQLVGRVFREIKRSRFHIKVVAPPHSQEVRVERPGPFLF